MEHRSLVTLRGSFKPDKEAKVSFHGSFWNVRDGSCLLTKASLQLFCRTLEKANSMLPGSCHIVHLKLKPYVLHFHEFVYFFQII